MSGSFKGVAFLLHIHIIINTLECEKIFGCLGIVCSFSPDTLTGLRKKVKDKIQLECEKMQVKKLLRIRLLDSFKSRFGFH